MSSHHYMVPDTTYNDELSRPKPNLDTSVSLHTFCANCQKFIKSWDVLDSSIQSLCEQASFMCTVAHLREAHRNCHFCKLVFESLYRYRFASLKDFEGANIYLLACVVRGDLAVKAYWNHDKPVGGKGMKCFADFCLGTYNYSDLDGAFHQHITRKKVPLLARDDVGLARSWIETCLACHRHCQEFQNTTVDRQQRPTRVLEVTGTTARLRCDMLNQDFEYLVLSHVWGENNETQLRLLENNLASFQVDIPWDRLSASATFAEAVRVTCALGYHYLWIDSLCIIQDSASDWEHEARRMAFVYGNATCNIACLFPPQDGSQPQTRDDPRTWNPCILRPATFTCPGMYIQHEASEWYDGQDWLMELKWPLFRRAWTFQEYLLSPRTLLVGHKNLMFQCSEIFYDELLGVVGDGHGMWIDNEKKSLCKDKGKSRYFSASMRAVATAPSLSSVVALSFMVDWWNVISEYRARKLSRAKDRVMAFAGIAQAVQHLGCLTYLAGAWKECLPLCLLWYMDKKLQHVARDQNDLPVGYIPSYPLKVQECVVQPAPTWSWFSVPIYAFHQPHFLLNDDLLTEDELSVRRKSNHNSPLVCFDDIFWAATVSFQFGEHPVNYFPDSGFFCFEELHITLLLKTLPVSANLAADLCAQIRTLKTSTECLDDRNFDCKPKFKYYPDDLKKKSKNPPKDGILALMTELQIVKTTGSFTIQRRFAGLVLTPGPREGTWKRVGVWKLKLRISDVVVDRENLAAVTRRWKEYQFASSNWEEESLTLI